MNIPPFTDEDVSWACSLLDLPPGAFTDRPGHDHGRDVLQLASTADIAACPGSGKTTLLVAKLAILARHWSERDSGMCVLSHTNVARNEIAQRLAAGGASESLLAYPHFVGTIQSFVNEFLALPWLRSLGYPIVAIDDDRCEQRRRTLLQKSSYATLRTAIRGLENGVRPTNIVSGLRIASAGCELVKHKGEQLFSSTAASSAQLHMLGNECARDGYFRFREMYVWAQDLIVRVPEIKSILRRRFPLLFVDEVQDNSEEQNIILHSLFFADPDPVVRQRYGDTNQAIFGDDDAPTTDVFPLLAIQRIIANSHRFGPQIAEFADPFAVAPQDLIGRGPNTEHISAETKDSHSVFLFDDDAVSRVMTVYAEYLIEIFSDTERKLGIFTAVGAVHRPSDNKLFVGRYWPDYNYELTGVEPRPSTFVDCFFEGRRRSLVSQNTSAAIESVASAILQCLRLESKFSALPARRRQHRQLLDMLQTTVIGREAYETLVAELVVQVNPVDQNSWEQRYRLYVHTIINGLVGRSGRIEALTEFLNWPREKTTDAVRETNISSGNTFRHKSGHSHVAIRMGSIHSVKGETHTSTMVLDVDYHGSQWKALKPWLLGQKRGAGREGPRNQKRLREHYVAMTRPTHLLCIAMRRSDINDTELATLKQKGWRVNHVQVGASGWL